MTSPVQLSVITPPLPRDWSPPETSAKSISRTYRNSIQSLHTLLSFFFSRGLIHYTALVQRTLLPVGPAYLAHVHRAVHNLSFEEHDKHAEEARKRLDELNGVGLNGEDDLGVGDEEESAELLLQDPKEWKVCGFVGFSSPLPDLTCVVETRSLRRPGSLAPPIHCYS